MYKNVLFKVRKVAFLGLLAFSCRSAQAQCTTPTATVGNNTSCMASNGSITATGPSPVAGFEFSKDGGVTFQPGNVFSGLAAGNYAIVARAVDLSCTSAVASFTVTNAPAVVTAPTASTVNPASCTVPDGSITITAPVGSYEFSIDNGLTFQAGASFTSLTAGTYQLVARSTTTGCVSAPTTVTLTNPAIAAPEATLVHPTSCTSPNGTITFTAPTPLAGFGFSINNGSTFQTSNAFAGLAAGIYQIRAKNNATGCVSAATSVTLSNPVIAAPTVTVANVTSCTVNNGSITVTAPTPLANYEFSKDIGTTYQVSNAFSSLAAGNYGVMVRQLATGCTSPVEYVAITNAPVTPATPTVTSVNATSCSAPNGSITVVTPTPLANYEFSVDNGTTFQAGNIFNNLPGGTYQVRARALATNCVSAALSRTLTRPSVTAPTASVTAPTACNVSNGSINITAPAAASHEFSKDGGSTFQSGNQFTALAPGTYQLVSRNLANGCTSAVTNSTVTNPAATTPTLTSANNTICSGTPNGSITVTAPVAGYEFSKDNGATYQGSNTFSNLAAGTYPIRVRNTSTACVSAVVNRAITLAPVTVTTPTTTFVNPTSCASPNGSITVTVPTPAASYEFSINNGNSFQGSNAFTGLAAGSYQVVARSIATGCKSAASARVLTAPAVNTPTVSAGTNNTICSGTPNGSFSVTAPAPLASYMFSKDNGATFQASNAFSSLAAGTYPVRIKQITNGCLSAVVNKTLTLAPAAVATPSVAVTQPASCSTPNGSVTVTPSPNVPANFLYSKDNGATFQASNVFGGLAAGTYQFRTKLISTGCMSAAVSSTLTAPAVTTPVATAVNNTNCSNPNGSINVTAPAPLASFEFSIDNGLSFQSGASFNGLAAGTYAIRARNLATGCVSAALSRTVANAFATVTAPTVTSANPLNCAPADGTITVTAPTPLTSYEFSVDNGVTFQAGNVFTGLSDGTYRVRVKSVATGCLSAATNRVLAAAPAPAMATVTKVDATTCVGDGSLTVTAPSPLGNYTFSKDNGVSYQASPSFASLAAGIYKVIAKSSTNGCTSPVNQLSLATSAVCPEICNNNIDDDQDGLTDAIDPDCACDAGTFNTGCNTTCQYQFTAAAFSVKKILSTPPSSITVYQTPMIGDIDQDGVNEIVLMSTNSFDGSGTGPGGITTYRWSRDVGVFNGQTGALESVIPTVDANGVGYDVGWSCFPAIALANVDDDLQSEVFVVAGHSTANISAGNDSYIFCYGADGTFKWKSNVRYGYASMTYRFGAAINIADFNGDGVAELYMYDQVFNARTGVLLAQGGGTRGMAVPNGDPTGNPAIGIPCHPVAADVFPNSPGLELVSGRTVYAVNLTNTAGTAGNTMTPTNAPAIPWGATPAYVRDGFASVADMDADGALDVVITWGDTTRAMAYVWNPRSNTIMGRVIVSQSSAAFSPGVAFVGNFDSDCGLEIGFCMSLKIVTYDFVSDTLMAKWNLVTTDASGITGLTLFDFNQDGKAEIVYRDQDNIRILDATTGTDVSTPIPCTSGTGLEMPVVADVRGDGTSQICVTCNTLSDATGTVNVFSSASQPWAPARGVWNQQAYHVTNINDDLSVPLVEYNVATALPGAGCTGCKNTPYNNFLQQATFRTQQGCVQFPAADAVASGASVAYGCDTSMVSYTLSNNADVAKLPAGTPVAFYSGDPAQAGAVLIGRDSLPGDLAPGASVNMTHGLILTPYGPSFSLFIAVNDTGTTTPPLDFPITNIPECNYTNNITPGLLVVRPTAGANPPTICQSGSITLQATGSAGGQWTADTTNPDTTAVIVQPDSLTTMVNKLDSGGVYRFYWNFNGCTDTVLVTVNTTPDAGPDKTVDCITTDAATLEASGEAVWTLLPGSAGTATISDPTSPTTIVNNFSATGTYIMTWTDSVGCGDTVEIFAFATCTPLSLDLLSFTAVKNGEHQVLLSWKTANEQHTDRFFVEKSADARVWNAIGTIMAAGNSTQKKAYSFNDVRPFDGINYYRLRMLDQDGSYKLSAIRKIVFGGTVNTVTLAPNPTGGRTVLSCAKPLAAATTVKVWNSMGRLVMSTMLPAGTTSYDIDLGQVPGGVYLVHVEGEEVQEQMKLVVQ